MSDNTNLKDKFAFDIVLFFGRSFAEYERMFGFKPGELKGLKILDCPGGPATFALEAEREGCDVTACDPVYGLSVDEIRVIVETQLQLCMDRQDEMFHLFDREKPVSADKEEKLLRIKMFLQDYDRKGKQRYMHAMLPNLPFADRSFDFAFSANFLFLYSDCSEGGMMINSPFDYQFHRAALLELMRVSRQEVRIYPLKGPHSKEHSYINKVLCDEAFSDFEIQIQPVTYRDVKDAHHMLRLVRRQEG